MAHDIIIIVDRIGEVINKLNGLQPDFDLWNALLAAVNAVETKIQQSSPVQHQAIRRLHDKLHEVELFLLAGEPYDLAQVEQFTAELNGLL